MRNLVTYLLFGVYIFILLVSIYAFSKQLPKIIMAFSIVSLLSLIIISGYAGLTTSCFFMVADFCEAVHSTIYENHFPIHGTSLGLVVSCYEVETKAALYSHQYLLYSVRNDLKSKMAKSTDVKADDYKSMAALSAEIKSVLETDVKYFTQCEHVYDNVQYSEKTLCVSAMDDLKQLIQSLIALLVFVLITSVGITRLKALVEKKTMEFEVRLI